MRNDPRAAPPPAKIGQGNVAPSLATLFSMAVCFFSDGSESVLLGEFAAK